MADVFVSYASQDRDRVEPLVAALTTDGLIVWWDRGIGIGSAFDREIERELDSAGCVVVVWSADSVESEWVRHEAFEAHSREALVPILIDNVRPPLAFRRAQTANMVGWPTTRGEFDAMLRAVRAKLLAGSASRRAAAPHHGGHIGDAASVAVLPFANVSPDPDQVHFVDGLTIELIHQLAKIPNLHVAGQTATFANKNRQGGHAELATTLGVEHLLEGSVRQFREQLRINIQLVNAHTGFQLWSADFDKRLDDIFAIQREISEAVAGALSVKLGGALPESLGGTRNAIAHAHYLRGTALSFQSDEANERAITELEQAVALDPGFCSAWVQLALTYGVRAHQRDRTEQSLRDMSRGVRRALETEPRLWRAHAAQGWYLLSRRRFLAADAAMTEAKRLQRTQESIVAMNFINYPQQVGRLTESVDEAKRLQSRDPVLSACHQKLYMLGRNEEAREAFAASKGISAGVDREYLTFLAMEQTEAAAADRILDAFSASRLGRMWFGSRDSVLATLRENFAQGERRRSEFVYDAMIATHHGDFDLAIGFLRAEYLVDGFGTFYLIWHPQLAPLRATTQFKTFLIDLGLPQMWRETGDWGDFAEPVGADDFRCW